MIDLPAGWDWAELGELGEWYGGATPSKREPRFWQGGTVPWLSPKDMGTDTLAGTQDKIAAKALDESPVRLVPSDSVAVVVRSGILARTMPVAFVPFATALNQDMKAIVPHAGIDARWVAWGLRAYERQVLRDTRKSGTTVASVEVSRLMRFRLPVPPSAEQQRIVAAIEASLARLIVGCARLKQGYSYSKTYNQVVEDRAALGRLIASRSNSPAVIESDLARISKQRSLRASKRRARPQAPSAFRYEIPAHWAVVSVDQLCWDIEYGTSVKTRDEEGPESVPVLRMGNVQESRIVMDNLKYLPKEGPDIESLILEDGDLLFNRTNSAELVGKSAVYRENIGPAAFASYLIRCRFASEANPDWVNLVINSSVGRSYITSVVSQQVGQANVNGTKLARMSIPFPPLSEQDEILAAVAEHAVFITRLRESLQIGLRRAESLRQSVLRSAFTGQLVPQDPADEAASVLLERIRAARPVARRGRRSGSAVVRGVAEL